MGGEMKMRRFRNIYSAELNGTSRAYSGRNRIATDVVGGLRRGGSREVRNPLPHP
jgi:hypothetical protein